MDKRTVTLHGDPFTVVGKQLQVNQEAPGFQLIDNDLQVKSLQDHGRKIKLLSVVPSLDTGVCDLQTRRFNEEVKNIPDATVITISADLPFAQKKMVRGGGRFRISHYPFGSSRCVFWQELRCAN